MSLQEVWVLLTQQLPSPLGGSDARLGSADAWEEEEEQTAVGNGSKAALPSCTRDSGRHFLPPKCSQVGVGPAWPWHSLERLESCLWPGEMLRMGNLAEAPGPMFIQVCWS